jgi:hypothetical protein
VEALEVFRLDVAQRISVSIPVQSDRHRNTEGIADDLCEIYGKVASLLVGQATRDGHAVVPGNLRIPPVLGCFHAIPELLRVRGPCRGTRGCHRDGADNFLPKFALPEIMGFPRPLVGQSEAKAVRGSGHG